MVNANSREIWKVATFVTKMDPMVNLKIHETLGFYEGGRTEGIILGCVPPHINTLGFCDIILGCSLKRRTMRATFQWARLLITLSRVNIIVKQAITWKMGEMRHMSISPDPRYWPVERKKVRRGTPKQRESSRNWEQNCYFHIFWDQIFWYYDQLVVKWWADDFKWR